MVELELAASPSHLAEVEDASKVDTPPKQSKHFDKTIISFSLSFYLNEIGFVSFAQL